VRYAIWCLAIISGLFTACLILPSPSRFLLPLTVSVPELSPWLVLLNVFCIWIAAQFRVRRALAIFLVSAVAAAVPVFLALQAAKSFEHAYPQTQRFSAMQFFQPLWFPPVLAQKLPMNILFYPGQGLGTRPVLVDIYGGAWQHGSPSVDDPFDRHMAGIGYAVFAIDYRHAPAFHFPAQIEDVQAALAYVRTNAAQYHGDASKIVLCGRSSGGELALLAAYDPAQAPVSAVIAFYSPSNLVRGFHELPWPDPLDVQKILADYIGGSPEQFADAYRAASPVTLATRRLPPTLLIQGGRDHVVSAQFTRQLYSRVKQTGSDVYLLELPWAEHSFDAVPSGIGNQVAMHALEAFLKTTAAAPLSSN
jgi:acetyl esterase/lipase